MCEVDDAAVFVRRGARDPGVQVIYEFSHGQSKFRYIDESSEETKARTAAQVFTNGKGDTWRGSQWKKSASGIIS